MQQQQQEQEQQEDLAAVVEVEVHWAPLRVMTHHITTTISSPSALPQGWQWQPLPLNNNSSSTQSHYHWQQVACQ